VGLQWNDFDFEKSTLLVQRGVVHGRVDDVKKEYSRDVVPIAPELATELLAYREGSYPTEAGWLFAQSCDGETLSSGGNSEEAHSESGEGRRHSDDDERLWQGDDGWQEAGTQQRSSNGPAGIGERRA
jgi:integrase